MPLQASDNDPRMPYQLPFPAEALAEIVIPTARRGEERCARHEKRENPCPREHPQPPSSPATSIAGGGCAFA